MTHMYFSARAEGRISYGHLGRTNLFYITLWIAENFLENLRRVILQSTQRE